MYYLQPGDSFPESSNFPETDLIAIGGKLSSSILMDAYQRGLFPWYNEGEIIQWWSPDPRCVLIPSELRISKSMKQVLAKSRFEFRMNTCFETVIKQCAITKRKQEEGTWISPEIIFHYTQLHSEGIAYSAETFLDNKLVGGLYGLRMGNTFFGESMFSTISNASKFAFCNLIEYLKKEGIVLIDCQVETEHLKSLGARAIPRKDFLQVISSNFLM